MSQIHDKESRCPKCGMDVREYTEICPGCGARVRRLGTGIWGVVADLFNALGKVLRELIWWW
ncbi:MAG: hypothetical protein P9L92_02980 [Candidatus Electryonea clarkiae]|nr:hypothetical protein [Candidatus Electryonea clarkiae]